MPRDVSRTHCFALLACSVYRLPSSPLISSHLLEKRATQCILFPNNVPFLGLAPTLHVLVSVGVSFHKPYLGGPNVLLIP